jgi:glycosyltransferase A (GT-A) superfamily protein (DUF2064 family)
LAALTQQYHLNWQSKNQVTRQTPGVDAQILQAAFALSQPKAELSVSGVALKDGQYALVGVKKVWPAKTQINSQQLASMQNQLENGYAQLDYQLYLNNLLKRANIKIYSNN